MAKELIRNVLSDIRVELGDEWDKNFQRQSFFTEKWQRCLTPPKKAGQAILVNTGMLRKSITVKSNDSSVTFSSSLEYSAIHNEGGEIKVTKKMKRFFWAMYHKCVGSWKRNPDNQEAEFWRAMAMKKEGSVIDIPQRQFLGYHKVVDIIIKKIVEDNLDEYIKSKGL